MTTTRMIPATKHSFVEHLVDFAFELASTTGRMIQGGLDARETNTPSYEDFRRLVRKSQVSFDNVIDDASRYIVDVENGTKEPLDYKTIENFVDQLKKIEADVKTVLGDPSVSDEVTSILEQYGYRRTVARARSRVALAAHVSKQRQFVPKTYTLDVSAEALSTATKIMSQGIRKQAEGQHG
ncbi:hypothetical protein [Vreelandella massiliensis]|uniref:hypothetical protein n=1 Tax=Vreelandella massiliensis TaxID=1816686 RepID=UPI00096ABA67|nr:hypothetical protein [Halomonas massiliensis]